MNSNTTISVVCPTYNSADFIVKSIKTIVNQTSPPTELIISDDGSTDDTIEKVKLLFNDYRGEINTIIIQNDHKGAGATRNAGIIASNSEWISFLDSDDLWFPDKILNVKETIKSNDKCNFIFHNEEYLRVNGAIEPFFDFSKFYRKDQSLQYQLWRYCIFHTSTITCKKDLLLRSGLFDESLMSSQDWDLWIKMSSHINYYHINKILGTYIERSNNITNTKSFKGLLDRLKIMSMYRKMCGASLWDYIYMAIRRIVGFILREIKIIK